MASALSLLGLRSYGKISELGNAQFQQIVSKVSAIKILAVTTAAPRGNSGSRPKQKPISKGRQINEVCKPLILGTRRKLPNRYHSFALWRCGVARGQVMQIVQWHCSLSRRAVVEIELKNPKLQRNPACRVAAICCKTIVLKIPGSRLPH